MKLTKRIFRLGNGRANANKLFWARQAAYWASAKCWWQKRGVVSRVEYCADNRIGALDWMERS